MWKLSLIWTSVVFSLAAEAYEEKCSMSSRTDRLCKKLLVRDHVKRYYASKVLTSAYCQDVWADGDRPAIVCYLRYGEREGEEFRRFGSLRLFRDDSFTASSDELENRAECIRDDSNRTDGYFYHLSEREYDFGRLCPYGWKRTCTEEGITCVSRNGGFENQPFHARNQIPALRNDSTWSPVALQVSTGLYYTPKEEFVPVIRGEVICITTWTELNAEIGGHRCHAITDRGCERVRNPFCFVVSGSPGNRFRIRHRFRLARDEELRADLEGGAYCARYMPFAYTYCAHSIANEASAIDESWGGRHSTTEFVFHFLIQRIKIEIPTVKKTAIRVIGFTIFTILSSLLYNIVANRISF